MIPIQSILLVFLLGGRIRANGQTVNYNTAERLSRRLQYDIASSTVLPFQDINILVVTDVHSWIAGQPHQPALIQPQQDGTRRAAHTNNMRSTSGGKSSSSTQKENNHAANYGHVLSLRQHLQENTLFFMNGDWMDGTGLATSLDSEGAPSYLIPLLEKMPFDAINIGNHELYQKSIIQYMTRPSGLFDWFHRQYITSNVVWAASTDPSSSQQNHLGNKFQLLSTQNGNHHVLVFGFLYNMQNNDPTTKVLEVETVVQQDWFFQALKELQYDAIVVMAHMDAQDSLVDVIRTEIRKHVPAQMPVQFLTGHTHERKYHQIDPYTSSFEPGHYLDTVGFCSFPTYASILQQEEIDNSTMKESSFFQHRFIDATVEAIMGVVNMTNEEDFMTQDGSDLAFMIQNTRQRLGLTEIVTTLDHSYFLNASWTQSENTEPRSLYGFLYNNIYPHYFPRDIVITNKGDLRYDLWEGTVTIDNLLQVSPFNETFIRWTSPSLQGLVISELQDRLNSHPEPFLTVLPEYMFTNSSQWDENATYTLVTNGYEEHYIFEVLKEVLKEEAIDCELTDTFWTSSEIWLDFFRQELHKNEKDRSKNHHHDKHNPSTPISIEDIMLDDENRDMVRIAFVILAVCVVASIGIGQVYQRTKRWEQYVQAEDVQILEAQREHDEEGYFL